MTDRAVNLVEEGIDCAVRVDIPEFTAGSAANLQPALAHLRLARLP